MLDEFSAAKISKPAQVEQQKSINQPAAEKPSSRSDEASNVPPDLGNGDEDEFTKQLSAGMAEMMKELESNPDMAKQFEQMMMGQFGMAENMSAPGTDESSAPSAENASSSKPAPTQAMPPASAGNGQTPQAGAPPPSFQDTIRQTMDRMKESNASASAASTAPGEGSDDFMAAMLKELAQAQGGANGNPEDAFSSMLLGMMEQLTNKEILYEPMKELDGKFPEWLAEREPGKPKADTITAEDRQKYAEQQGLVKEIVQRFEKPGYNDQNTEDREFIVERMQKMQAAGAPPADLVGDMGGAAEMLGDMDSQCPQQ